MLERKRKRFGGAWASSKESALEQLVLADAYKTAAAFNATFLEHVAWAFRMTSDLRNKIAGRGVAITRVRKALQYDGPTGLEMRNAPLLPSGLHVSAFNILHCIPLQQE